MTDPSHGDIRCAYCGNPTDLTSMHVHECGNTKLDDPCDDWPVAVIGANVMILHPRYEANKHCGTSFANMGRADWLFASGDADPFADQGNRRWFPVMDARTRPEHHIPFDYRYRPTVPVTIAELIDHGHLAALDFHPVRLDEPSRMKIKGVISYDNVIGLKTCCNPDNDPSIRGTCVGCPKRKDA